MAILQAANSLWLNVFLLVFIMLMVTVLPLIDRAVCKKLGISFTHSLTANPKNEQLLALRQFVLFVIFALYLAANVYLVFLSRGEGTDYSIHVDPLADLSNSFEMQCTFAEMLSLLMSGDFAGAVSKITIVKWEDITQATANILFYVPLGYLLPYVFKWFRKNKHRAVWACFLFSAATENLQLIFRRGCYDFDDVLYNTLGGLIGVILFRWFALYVTNPGWLKKEVVYNRFLRKSRKTALSRLANDMDCGRVTMQATDAKAISAFFVDTLGFRPRGEITAPEADRTTICLQLGGLTIEFVCSNTGRELPEQSVMITTSGLKQVRKRLEKKGIAVSDYIPDPYTGHRSMYITGPDNIKIIFGEY